jgi:predicted amidohydrolase
MLSMLPHGAQPIAGFPKFIVYPEFSLQGFPTSAHGLQIEPFRRWLKEAAVTIPGKVTDAFAKKSSEHGVYLQACVWEKHADFPEHYFESVFITDPEGQVAYVRRRVALPPSFGVTTPGEILSEYLKKFGPDPVDALFPVLKTPYGTVGGMLCSEMSTPEIMRALVLNGAEIILHSTSEPHGILIDGKFFRDLERRVRAFENMVVLASANIGEMTDCNMPRGRNRGHSEILDHRGTTLTVAEAPGEVIVTANVDMRALRAARLTEWSMLNWGPLINAVYAPVYLNRTVWPHDVKPLDAEGVKKLKQEVVESLAQRQMITKP